MWNFYRSIFLNIFRIIYYVVKAEIWFKSPEKHSLKERYEVCREMIYYMNRSSGYKTIAYGLENLPKEGGYMLYPNHQGKYDVCGIMATHDEPISFVMDDKRSHMILMKQFLELAEGKRIILDDLRQTLTVFEQIAGELKEGRRYILFPEGGYKENNRNIVEPFKPGSFKLALMSHVPIIPVALVDSYKVYNSDVFGPVTTYVYYLEPIYYEEYMNMKTKDIAAIVESRIKAKIAEHLKEHEVTD